MNPDKLLTLLMGKCWHEPKDANNPFAKSPCIHCGKTLIHWPHGWFAEGESINPSYSDPRHRDEFFTWLTRENYAMWEEFKVWIKPIYYASYAVDIISWLFFSDPARPRDLMAEWLRLPETVERFGWEERYCDHCRKGDVQMHYTHPCEKCGAIGGKVLSAWAKYAKEAK